MLKLRLVSLKLLNFWTLFSNIFPILDPKILFFLLKLSPSLFFWPEKSFFFVLKIGHFLAFILNFFPNFLPKLSPSLFLWPKKSFFFKLVNFWTLLPSSAQAPAQMGLSWLYSQLIQPPTT